MSESAFGQSSGATVAASQALAPRRADETTKASFSASIQGHQICFSVPAGSVIDAHSIDLPGGILILGALRGRVRCLTGTAIIAKGGEFQGNLEANDVLVEGKITSPDSPGDKMTEIRARGQRNAQGAVVGGIVAISANAFVSARLQAVAYQIPRSANLYRCVFETTPPETV